MKVNIDLIKPTKSIKNDDFKVKTLLEKSIKKYGQIYPIVVNADYEIIKGNTVYSILKKLKFEQIEIKIIDCNSAQLCLELNLLKGEPNPIECFSLMKEIDKSDNCLPYTKDQINDFIKLLSFDWGQYKKTFSNISELF